MEEKMQVFLLAGLTALIMLFSGFLLNASGLEAIQLANFKEIMPTLQKLISAPFTALIITTALFFALASTVCLKKDKTFAYKSLLPGVIIGIALSLALFGISTEKTFLAIFFTASILLLIEAAFLKREEFKKFKAFRTADNATKKAIFIIAAGLFASTAFIITTNQQEFIQNFEQATLELALGQSKNSNIADVSTNLIIQANKQALQLMTQTQQFEKLKTKNDEDVKNFVAMMDDMQKQIDDPAKKEALGKEIQARTEILKKEISFDVIKKQAPFINVLEEFYWLLAAFGIASLVLLVGNIIVSPMASFFTAILSLLWKQETN